MKVQSFGSVKKELTMTRIAGGRGAWLAAGAAMLALTLMAGCRQQPAAPTDSQLTGAIQSKIQGEQALAGQNIQVSVSKGVATLSGTAANDASRALAGNDAGSVSGIRTVVNNLMVQPGQSAAAAPAPSVERKEETRRGSYHQEQAKAASRHDRERDHRQEQANLPPSSDLANLAPVPQPVPQPAPQPVQPSAPVAARAAAPPPVPAAPPKPVIRRVTIPAGTIVPVTLTETLDSKTAEPNQVFHAVLAHDLVEDGVVAIPRGAPVLGEVVDARKAGHFRGEALLEVQLTQLTLHGQKIGLMTETYSKDGASGRGKNTAEKTGGGALFGAVVGALAGGGKGAAIGALAGGGAGAGVNAVTRGKEVEIPSEARVDFRLQEPVTVTVYPPGSAQAHQGDEPHLIRSQQ
jgi:BON domain